MSRSSFLRAAAECFLLAAQQDGGGEVPLQPVTALLRGVVPPQAQIEPACKTEEGHRAGDEETARPRAQAGQPGEAASVPTRPGAGAGGARDEKNEKTDGKIDGEQAAKAVVQAAEPQVVGGCAAWQRAPGEHAAAMAPGGSLQAPIGARPRIVEVAKGPAGPGAAAAADAAARPVGAQAAVHAAELGRIAAAADDAEWQAEEDYGGYIDVAKHAYKGATRDPPLPLPPWRQAAARGERAAARGFVRHLRVGVAAARSLDPYSHRRTIDWDPRRLGSRLLAYLKHGRRLRRGRCGPGRFGRIAADVLAWECDSTVEAVLEAVERSANRLQARQARGWLAVWATAPTWRCDDPVYADDWEPEEQQEDAEAEGKAAEVDGLEDDARARAGGAWADDGRPCRGGGAGIATPPRGPRQPSEPPPTWRMEDGAADEVADGDDAAGERPRGGVQPDEQERAEAQRAFDELREPGDEQPGAYVTRRAAAGENDFFAPEVKAEPVHEGVQSDGEEPVAPRGHMELLQALREKYLEISSDEDDEGEPGVSAAAGAVEPAEELAQESAADCERADDDHAAAVADDYQVAAPARPIGAPRRWKAPGSWKTLRRRLQKKAQVRRGEREARPTLQERRARAAAAGAAAGGERKRAAAPLARRGGA